MTTCLFNTWARYLVRCFERFRASIILHTTPKKGPILNQDTLGQAFSRDSVTTAYCGGRVKFSVSRPTHPSIAPNAPLTPRPTLHAAIAVGEGASGRPVEQVGARGAKPLLLLLLLLLPSRRRQRLRLAATKNSGPAAVTRCGPCPSSELQCVVLASAWTLQEFRECKVANDELKSHSDACSGWGL